MRKRKHAPTNVQLERRIRRCLRRNGMEAGKRLASRHGYTVSSSMLKTAALWWERARHRAKEKKDFIDNHGRFAWQLLRLRIRQAQDEERYGVPT